MNITCLRSAVPPRPASAVVHNVAGVDEQRRCRAGGNQEHRELHEGSCCGHSSEHLPMVTRIHPRCALSPLSSLQDHLVLDNSHRAFSHRRMSLKTGVGAFCVAGAPFWFFGFDLGTGESSSGLWDCGNRGAISKGGGKRRETWFWFSSFSIARHFHSPLPAVQHGVFAERKLANSFCLARCIRRAAAVSLSAWAMRPRASSLCPGLR